MPTPTPTHRYMNWSLTMFSSTAIDGVKDISYNPGLTLLKESADMDIGPSIALQTFHDPTFTVNTINPDIMISLETTRAIFTTTMNDALNQNTTGGGGVTFTTNSSSFIGDNSIHGSHLQLSTNSFTVNTMWPDGVTNPVSVSAV